MLGQRFVILQHVRCGGACSLVPPVCACVGELPRPVAQVAMLGKFEGFTFKVGAISILARLALVLALLFDIQRNSHLEALVQVLQSVLVSGFAREGSKLSSKDMSRALHYMQAPERLLTLIFVYVTCAGW